MLVISSEALAPVIEAAIAKAMDTFGNPDRLSYTESEAAGLMGYPEHVIRDARIRGELTGGFKVGRTWNYTRSDLLKFIESRRRKATE